MSCLVQALNERKVEIRVQFKPPVALPGNKAVLDGFRNELVVRFQPDEAIYMKFALKQPGLEMTPIMSELDLTYRVRDTPRVRLAQLRRHEYPLSWPRTLSLPLSRSDTVMRTSLRLTSASSWMPCMVISSISFEGGVLLLTHTMCVLQDLRAHKLFCCRDELNAAWKIFTPVLHAIDRGELVPSQYQAGTAPL